MAATAAVEPHPREESPMVVLVTILSVVVAMLALLVAGLLRSHAEIIRTLQELGGDIGSRASTSSEAVAAPTSGSRAPSDLVGTSPDGDAVSIGVVGARHSTLLAFLSSGCHTCADFWASFADADALDVPGDARLVIVTKDGGEESHSKIGKLAPVDVPVVMSNPAWQAYDVPVVPYFVYVDGPSRQIIGEGAAPNWQQVGSLLGQALEDAGLVDGNGRRRRGVRARPRRDADREARVDQDLLAAGITPGDPSLYPTSADDLQAPGDHPDRPR
jgi:hypothetical protein